MRSLIKYCYLTILLVGGWGYFAQAQVIDDMEYFIDDGDLGVGSNPKVAISPGATITESFTVPTAALSVGFHTIYFRTHEQISDLWSISESRSFYISASNSTTQASIIDVEYFIDADPGYGAGTRLSPAAATTVTLTPTIPAATLPPGFHTLYIRSLDSDGIWGVMESRSFYVSPSDLTTQANIVDVEYFIDSDPGYGAATSLGPFAATTVNFSLVIATSVLPAGFHTLYIRALDSDGVWGDLESRSFYIGTSDLTSQANIMALEYFIDNDPGYGSGTTIPITAASNVNISTTIATNALSAGHHVLYLRALDQDGVWSELESRSFFLDQFTGGKLAGIEYFYDNDPGYGNGILIDVTPPEDSIDMAVVLPANTLPAGNHVVGMRMLDELGNIGLTDYYNVIICDGALASISSDVVCIGGVTTISDVSTGVLAGDVFSWDVDGNAVEDFNTPGDKVFTYPAPGLYTATLTIDRLGCITTSTIQVDVPAIPVANAGLDQTNCTDTAVLAANAPVAGETGGWTVLNGATDIVDPLDPFTTINNITSSSVELMWLLTNTLGGCFSSDTVFIVPNLAINAVQTNATVEIGQMINLAVQSGATINSGDVLTSSIVLQPANGIAAVLADGTIDYSPNSDAVGADTLTFRLCNQCSNCSDNLVIIGLTNQPPTITPPPANAGTNPIFTLDLTSIVADANGNIDLNSLRIVSQPISGATASIDASGILTIDYTGITFSGQDQLSIEVCDLSGACTVQVMAIDVEAAGEAPPITVYNAVSPNGDGYHEFLEIENIQFYPENRVFVLSRWGVKVAEFIFYDNQSNVFTGSTLPSGVYYYHIIPGPDIAEITGHFVLKVDP